MQLHPQLQLGSGMGGIAWKLMGLATAAPGLIEILVSLAMVSRFRCLLNYVDHCTGMLRGPCLGPTTLHQRLQFAHLR